MCMVLGMFTGGIAYNTKQGITSGAREGSRYGATLPLVASPCSSASGSSTIQQWLSCVTSVTVAAASGELSTSASGMKVCVAFINDTGTSNSTDDVTQYEETVGTATPTFGSTDCYSKYSLASDGMSGKRRVQIVAMRTKKLEAMFFSTTLNLTSSSVTPYEPTTS